MIADTRWRVPLPGRNQNRANPTAAPMTNAPRSHHTSFGSVRRAIAKVSANCWRRFVFGGSGVLAMRVFPVVGGGAGRGRRWESDGRGGASVHRLTVQA